MKIVLFAFLLGVGFIAYELISHPMIVEAVDAKESTVSGSGSRSGLRGPGGAPKGSSEPDAESNRDSAARKVPLGSDHAPGETNPLSHEEKIELMRQRGRAVAERVAEDRQAKKDSTSWFALPLRVQGKVDGLLICEVDLPEAQSPVMPSYSSGLGSVGGAAGETGGGAQSYETDVRDLLVAEAPGGGGRARLPRVGESLAIAGHPDFEKLSAGSTIAPAMVSAGLRHVGGQALPIFKYYRP